MRPAINMVLHFEGGRVDDPNDPGGLTNWGISLRAYPSLGREGIINLTRDEAGDIYERDYWVKAGCDQLPASVATLIVDSAVNQGVGAAIKFLQKALGLTPDGKLGPGTLQAVSRKSERMLCTEIATRRALHYASLTIFGRYGLGWLRRLFTCYGVAVSQIKE